MKYSPSFYFLKGKFCTSRNDEQLRLMMILSLVIFQLPPQIDDTWSSSSKGESEQRAGKSRLLYLLKLPYNNVKGKGHLDGVCVCGTWEKES